MPRKQTYAREQGKLIRIPSKIVAWAEKEAVKRGVRWTKIIRETLEAAVK